MMIYAKVMQYEVYWCDFPIIANGVVGGRRPCIVISNNKEATNCDNIMVIPTTTNIKRTDLPCNVLVNVQGHKKSIAMCNQIRSVPKT